MIITQYFLKSCLYFPLMNIHKKITVSYEMYGKYHSLFRTLPVNCEAILTLSIL